MNHITYVDLVFQELNNCCAAPLLAVVASRRPLSSLPKIILGRCVHTLSIELGGDVAPAVAARELSEKPFDDLGGWRVDHQQVFYPRAT